MLTHWATADLIIIIFSPLSHQCICDSGRGGLYWAGSIPELHSGHTRVCIQQVSAQEPADPVWCYRHPRRLCRTSSEPASTITALLLYVNGQFVILINTYCDSCLTGIHPKAHAASHSEMEWAERWRQGSVPLVGGKLVTLHCDI